MTEKSKYLQDLYKVFGDYELFYVKGFDKENKKAIAGWNTWKSFSEATDEDIALANLRSVLKPEIVLDIEEPERFEPIVKELNKLPITFSAFSTGSRGYHIHLIFNDLTNMDNNNVTLIKDRIIKHFGCDVSKKSERNLIALEYEKHFKTGNPKTIVLSQSRGENKLNLFLATTIKLKDVKDGNPKFYDLFVNGAWQKWGFPSRSEAEESLCSTLAIEGFDFEEIYSIMQMSNVGKWQTAHDKYKEITISKAIQLASSKSIITEELFTEPLFKFFEEYGTPQPVEWLVPKYIPAKGVCIITGRAGCGKSFVTEEMISAILNKRKLFNQMDIVQDQPVVLIDMENDHSTLYERLNKLGGIPEKKLLVFNAFELNFEITNKEMNKILLEKIDELNPCVVIFDTLRRVYSGDENDSQVINDVYKQFLAPIAKKRCCMVIAHTRKGMKNATTDDDMSEIRGTGDIVGLASAVIILKPNPDETISVKPIKLRPAKLAQAFTIKITERDGKFFIEITNDIPIKTEIEVMADKLFEWLKHNKKPMETVSSKEMTGYLLSEGHNRRMVFRGITHLCQQGWIQRTARGYYIFKYGDDTIVNFMPDG